MKKNNKSILVSIAISAYNEESNIKQVLRTILSQKENGYRLLEILLFLDGTTDETEKEARSLQIKKLKIFRYTTRLGKPVRLSHAYRIAKGNVFVQIDGDIVLANNHVLGNLVKQFAKNKKTGMVGGKLIPVEPSGFTEKAVKCTYDAYRQAIETYRNGHNVFTVSGAFLAFRTSLLKKIHVPQDVVADDVYMYYFILTNNFSYRYAKSAGALFRLPQTLSDQIKQNSRYMTSEDRMRDYYPAILVDKESYLPKRLIYPGLISVFLKHPILSVYIFLINKYCSIKPKEKIKIVGDAWSVSQSTKKLIKN